MKQELQEKIDKWLGNYRKSEGGYARITKQDTTDLYEIIFDLIAEKCDVEPDGDIPWRVTLTNMRIEMPICPHIPSRLREQYDQIGLKEDGYKVLTDKQVIMRNLEAMASVISQVSSQFEREMSYLNRISEK